MSQTNMFEKASRLKLRFDTGRGALTTENLWELSLTDLDTLARKVNKELKSEDEESFIPPNASDSAKRKQPTYNELRLGILKHIIVVKVEERDKAKIKAEAKANIAKIKELIEAKATEQLAAMSLDDAKKRLAELELVAAD